MKKKPGRHNYLIILAVALIALTVAFFLLAHDKTAEPATGQATEKPVQKEPEPVYSVEIFQAQGDTLVLKNTGDAELTNETMKVFVNGEEQPCEWSLRPGLLQACILREQCTGKYVTVSLFSNVSASADCS